MIWSSVLIVSDSTDGAEKKNMAFGADVLVVFHRTLYYLINIRKFLSNCEESTSDDDDDSDDRC